MKTIDTRFHIETLDITKSDRLILRKLAKQVYILSENEENAKKRELWYIHNSLDKTQPLIFFDPETSWRELITLRDFHCQGDLARKWEHELLMTVFRGNNIPDDKVIEPYFDIPVSYTTSTWGIEAKQIKSDRLGSYSWSSPLKDYQQIEILKTPEIFVHEVESKRLMELAQWVFGDILKVRRKTWWWWSLGLTLTAVHLRGLQKFMLDMHDEPEGVHALMKVLSKGFLEMLSYLELEGLLSDNNDSYVGSGGFGYNRELPKLGYQSNRVRMKDMWGFGESQETSCISPKMFSEFVLPYQLPILEKFGLNCYGCCEALDERWKYIQSIPNLRRVSVSPWSNVQNMADKLKDKYVLSLKPNPSYFAYTKLNEEQVKKEIKMQLQYTKNCNLEIIMKDTTTVKGNPRNITRWCEIIREEIRKVF